MTHGRDQRKTNAAYYARNRDREIERVRRRQGARLDLLRELRRRPCADCDRRYEPHQMDFDHRNPPTKSFRLSSSRGMLAGEADLRREIAKCDVVCANCHRVRTIRAERARHKCEGVERTKETERWRAQAWVLAQLRDRPCADCGQEFLPFVMEFDH